MARPPLDLDKTREVLRRYAQKEKCLSYSSLASELPEASGQDRKNPEQSGKGMVAHLNKLIKQQDKNGPCLSAIVVSDGDLPEDYEHGTVVMKAKLTGFVKNARKEGYQGPKNNNDFVRYHQLLTFAWSLKDR